MAGTLGASMFDCYNELLCLGSTVNNLSDAVPAFDKQCQAGHTGPVCALCEEGYMRQGGECAECPQFNAPNVIGVVALILAVAAAIGLLYRKRKSRWVQPEVLKITITFFEIISVMNETFGDVGWPAAYRNVTSFIRAAFANVAELTALACAVHVNRFVHLAIWTLGVLLALVVVYALFRRAARRAGGAVRARLRQTCIERCFYVLFFAYPLLSPVVISIFICRTVAGTSYLVADHDPLSHTDVEAGGGVEHVLDHFLRCGFSFVVFVLLRRRVAAVAFVAEPFKPTGISRYWEVVVFAKKLFLTSILFSLPRGTSTRTSLAVLVSMLSLVLVLWHRPYLEDAHNRLEAAAWGALAITYFIVLLLKVHPTSSQRRVYGVILILLLVLVVLTAVWASVSLRDVAKHVLRKHRADDVSTGIELRTNSQRAILMWWITRRTAALTKILGQMQRGRALKPFSGTGSTTPAQTWSSPTARRAPHIPKWWRTRRTAVLEIRSIQQ